MMKKATYDELSQRIRELEQAVSNGERIDETLRENESYLRTLIKTIPDLVWLKDPQGSYLLCNSRFEAFYGVGEHEIIGKTDYDFVTKQQADVFRQNDQLAITEGKPCKNEEAIIFAQDGHCEILETIKTPVYAYDGRLLGVLGIGRDITERKVAEDSFKELIALHKTVLNTIMVGLVFIRDGIIEWTNKAFPSLFGYEYSEISGKNIASFFADNELFGKNEGENHTLLARGETYSGELQGKKKDDSVFWCSLSGNAVNPRDLSEGSIWVIQDINERKKMEDRMQHLQRIESIGRLAGGIAHDFNNILGVIIGEAEMALLELDSDDPVYGKLNEIITAAERSSALTRQLLAFARKQTVAPKVLDLNVTISGMLRMVQTLIGENINLIWRPGERIWPLFIDPSQLDQILTNLCVNARDAITDVGTIIIKTEMVTIDEMYCHAHPGSIPGDYVVISISDTGSGMEKSVIDNIFEPFFTTKGPGKGTGLGLATVYGIVKQNNGFVSVYSEMGKGTTFTIYLPRQITDTVQLSKEQQHVAVTNGHETVLLVEDAPALLEMTRKMLEKLGYRVIPAASPVEALQLAEKLTDPIDLCLTDVIMPGMNGKVLTEKIIAFHTRMKCLFMSGYTDNIIAHRGILDKGIHFIQKPFSLPVLSKKIIEVLSS